MFGLEGCDDRQPISGGHGKRNIRESKYALPTHMITLWLPQLSDLTHDAVVYFDRSLGDVGLGSDYLPGTEFRNGSTYHNGKVSLGILRSHLQKETRLTARRVYDLDRRLDDRRSSSEKPSCKYADPLRCVRTSQDTPLGR